MLNEQLLDESLREFAVVATEWFAERPFVKERSDFFHRFFKAENLEKAEWKDFQELGERIHAFSSNSLAKANAFGRPNYEIEQYRETFRRLAHGKGTAEARLREFNQREGSTKKYIGPSAQSEIIGYLTSDTHVFYNRRDMEAAEYLGVDPDFERGMDDPAKFEAFNKAIAPVVTRYRELIPLQEDIPIGLQVDQFFSWIYESKIEPDSTADKSTTAGKSASDSFLNEETFELLELLKAEPKKATYDAHKERFVARVQEPIKKLLEGVVPELPTELTERLETGKGMFSRIVKNDYGQGGAWSHYWGAIYSKGAKRTAAIQLFVIINSDRLRSGFSIGDNGTEYDVRLQKNLHEHKAQLKDLLADNFTAMPFRFGLEDKETTDWQAWLKSPGEFGYEVVLYQSPDEAIVKTYEEHHALVLQCFQLLFPLVILASEDDPMGHVIKYLGEADESDDDEPSPEYPLTECARTTGFDLQMLQTWIAALERKKQAVLYGPPGTGKTFVAQELAKHLIGGGTGFSELVQFHPAYEYEDFMIGIRPEETKSGGLTYKPQAGRFLDFCDRARREPGLCVLIIDEINRANLARVFGELMYLLEYRDQEIPLAGGRRLRIPKNVRIIGTMNTADRSIALVDHALRRRFAFLELSPKYEVLERFHANTGFEVGSLVKVLRRLNNAIADKHYEVGISFFLDDSLETNLPLIWQMEIEPYLEEYFFDQEAKVDEFRWDKIVGEVL
jgi:5-methylcytosine-specific restriction protein B